MSEKVEKNADSPKDGSDKSNDSVTKEVDSGREDLVSKYKQNRQYLKDGGTSGVSTLLGKPELVDEKISAPTLVEKYDAKADAGKTTPADAKEKAPAPLEEPGKVKERIPANKIPGHPFEEVHYEDGTKRQLRPGGTILEMRPDGVTITARPDNTMSIKGLDGKDREFKPSNPGKQEVTKSWVSKDGDMVMYDYKDGTSEAIFSDGRHRIYDKDHGYKEYDKDGKPTGDRTNYKDGTEVTRDEQGRITGTADLSENKAMTRHFSYDEKTGELDYIRGNLGTWKRHVDEKTGKTYWQNDEKPDMKWHGDMKVDKEGNIHYTPHDRNAQAWTFTRDGKDVRR